MLVSSNAWRRAALTALGPPPRMPPACVQDGPTQLPPRKFRPVQVRIEKLGPKQVLRSLPPNKQSSHQQPMLRHFRPLQPPVPTTQSKPIQPLNMQPSPAHLPFVQPGPIHRLGMQLKPLQMSPRQCMPEQPRLTQKMPVSRQSLFQV